MHYANVGVTNKDHLIIILVSTSINYFLYPFSCIDIMAGFHIPGDPYFPNEGNDGWFREEPEDDHPIPLDDHHCNSPDSQVSFILIIFGVLRGDSASWSSNSSSMIAVWGRVRVRTRRVHAV
mgnify:CR=1 FL=1